MCPRSQHPKAESHSRCLDRPMPTGGMAQGPGTTGYIASGETKRADFLARTPESVTRWRTPGMRPNMEPIFTERQPPRPLAVPPYRVATRLTALSSSPSSMMHTQLLDPGRGALSATPSGYVASELWPRLDSAMCVCVRAGVCVCVFWSCTLVLEYLVSLFRICCTGFCPLDSQSKEVCVVVAYDMSVWVSTNLPVLRSQRHLYLCSVGGCRSTKLYANYSYYTPRLESETFGSPLTHASAYDGEALHWGLNLDDVEHKQTPANKLPKQHRHPSSPPEKVDLFCKDDANARWNMHEQTELADIGIDVCMQVVHSNQGSLADPFHSQTKPISLGHSHHKCLERLSSFPKGRLALN